MIRILLAMLMLSVVSAYADQDDDSVEASAKMLQLGAHMSSFISTTTPVKAQRFLMSRLMIAFHDNHVDTIRGERCIGKIGEDFIKIKDGIYPIRNIWLGSCGTNKKIGIAIFYLCENLEFIEYRYTDRTIYYIVDRSNDIGITVFPIKN